MKTEFGTAGDVRDVDLLAAFVAFWRERSSGVVSFTRGGGSAAFSLADGEVVSVSSSEPRFESAAILVRAGKLDAAALDRLAMPEGSDGSLAALQAGILTKREWRWGEKIRAIEILADLLAWPDGKYYFDSDARPQPGDFNLAVPRLILELFLRSRDRHFVEHQLGPTDAPIVRSEGFEREFATFGLTADAESVVRLIDGRASADDIARGAPADEFAVRKLLAALTTLGLVRGGEGAVPAAASDDSEPDREEAERQLSYETVIPAPPPPVDPEVDPYRAEHDEPGSERPGPADLATTEFESPAVPAPAWPSDRAAFDVPPTRLLDGYPVAYEPELRGRQSEEATVVEESGPSAFDPLPTNPPERLQEEMPEPPRSGAGKALGWSLLALVLIVGGLLYWRSHPVGSTSTLAAAGTPAPSPSAGAAPSSVLSPASAAPVAALPTSLPAAIPTLPSSAASRRAATPDAAAAAAARRQPTGAPRTAAATRPTPVIHPTARAASGPVPERAAGAGGRSDWTARAARDKRRLSADRKTKYSIQLELACEVPSLAEAWKHDRPAGTMWLLTTPHGGRECFRVLWGRYPSIDAARRAKAKIPPFFATGSNRPAVVGVR